MKNLKIELEKLFEKWREDHKNDILYEYDTPGVNGKFIPKENFISDGFCIYETFKENTVLYICKESHAYNYNSNLDELKNEEYLYLKKNFNNNKNPIFARRIKMMQKEFVDLLGKSEEDISFMNINKRGGFLNTDMAILNIYAMQFSNNIVKEIEIINPEIIVCCGKGIKRIIEMIYRKCNKKINRNIFEVPHPSRLITDAEYKNCLTSQIKHII